MSDTDDSTQGASHPEPHFNAAVKLYLYRGLLSVIQHNERIEARSCKTEVENQIESTNAK